MAFSIAAFRSGVTMHTLRINPDVAAAKAMHLVGEGGTCPSKMLQAGNIRHMSFRELLRMIDSALRPLRLEMLLLRLAAYEDEIAV